MPAKRVLHPMAVAGKAPSYRSALRVHPEGRACGRAASRHAKPLCAQRRSACLRGRLGYPLPFYLMSQRAMAAFSEELDELGLRYSKGTISFKPDNPLPDDLVARIVKHRIAKNRAMKVAASAKRKAPRDSRSKPR